MSSDTTTFRGSTQQRSSWRIGAIDIGAPLCIGTMMWGNAGLDRLLGVNKPSRGKPGASSVIPDETLTSIVRAASSHGVRLYDTAEGYGGGTSEVRLRKALTAAERPEGQESDDTTNAAKDEKVVITKYLPVPWRLTLDSFLRSVRGSARRLGGKIDVLLIHTPMSLLSVETLVGWALVARDAEGLCAEIGVSNFTADQVRRAQAVTRRAGARGIACCEIHVSLITHGARNLKECIDVCKENDITVVGFSPLGQGLLCDGLTEPDVRRIRASWVTSVTWADLVPLRKAVSEVAEAHGVPMAAVCVAWSIARGIIPLVGCRTERHLESSAAALGLSLSREEVERLERNALGRSNLGKPRWRRVAFISVLSCVVFGYFVEHFIFGEPGL